MLDEALGTTRATARAPPTILRYLSRTICVYSRGDPGGRPSTHSAVALALIQRSPWHSFSGRPGTHSQSLGKAKVHAVQHVMIDLYGCDPELLANEGLLREVLDEYPGHIGMEKVSPVVLRIKYIFPYIQKRRGRVVSECLVVVL
ncbi:MAG: hypothetical protein ACR2H5_19705 [Ktedonobacteraceae bacterium]